MEIIRQLLAFVLDLDAQLTALVSTLGPWVYALLFAVIFCETGLVVTPFLPGDSLLFAAGALAGAGLLNPIGLAALLFLAAVLGDLVNYLIGRRFGRWLLSRPRRIIKQRHMAQTEAFFGRHGGKAIVLARFVPIVRTFAPFFAGMARMSLTRFWSFNISGAAVWVLLFAGAGYLFGNVPVVEENLTLVMLGVVVISVMPAVFEWSRHRSATGERRRASGSGSDGVRESGFGGE